MSSPSPPPQFQFSLRWMLVAVTAVAVLLGLTAIARAFPQLLAQIVYLLYPTPLLMAAIFARGDIRAFSIGALIPWVCIWGDKGPPHSTDWENFIGFVIWLLFFGGLCGIVAVATRRWIERRGGSDAT